MLVQASQSQNTECERETAGRRTKSIAPGLRFCVVSERRWSFLPPRDFDLVLWSVRKNSTAFTTDKSTLFF